MQKSRSSIRPILLEILFQLGLLTLVFIFYIFEKHKATVFLNIEPFRVLFFINYVVSAMLINYVLLPLFLYKKKYLKFIFWSAVTLALVIFIEEGVIEKILFPDTRGRYFPGIFNNLLSAMPIITILVGFKFAWDALRKQRQLELLQSAIKESELQFLKTQINPHFLFNNLNNLYSYALEQSPKTPEIILELSGVLRYMLYECKEATVPLRKEIEQLENFVNLSKLQFEERGEVMFTVGNIEYENRIAPLILSVFIENAFKHSSSSQNNEIEIKINIDWKEDNQFVFTCENSYSEQSNTDSLSKGIGLENVKKRLHLLYPAKHKLKINVSEKRYIVELTLQLENDH